MDIQEFLKLINLIASSFASENIFTWIRHEITSPQELVLFSINWKTYFTLTNLSVNEKKTEFMEMNIHDFHM